MKKLFFVSFISIILIGIFVVVNIWLDKRNEDVYGDYQSENEFLRTIDCASLFDANPTGTRYKVSFDIKTKAPGKMIIYQQNGSDFRYSWDPYPTIETTTEYTHYEIEIKPILVNSDVSEAFLSFYGTYGSGVIPTIKNIRIEPI